MKHPGEVLLQLRDLMKGANDKVDACEQRLRALEHRCERLEKEGARPGSWADPADVAIMICLAGSVVVAATGNDGWGWLLGMAFLLAMGRS